MKLLSDVSLTENDVNNQLKVTQIISKINTLMDVADVNRTNPDVNRSVHGAYTERTRSVHERKRRVARE